MSVKDADGTMAVFKQWSIIKRGARDIWKDLRAKSASTLDTGHIGLEKSAMTESSAGTSVTVPEEASLKLAVC